MSYEEKLGVEGFTVPGDVAKGVDALREGLLSCTRKELVAFVRTGIRERIEKQAREEGKEDPFAKLDPHTTSVTEMFKADIADKFTRVGVRTIFKMGAFTENDMKWDLGLTRREIRKIAIVLRLFGVLLRN